MDIAKLETTLEKAGERAYRIEQAKRAVFDDLISSWDEASTLSKDLRTMLEREVPFSSVEHVTTQTSERGDTVKSLFKLRDGKNIEAVLMRHHGDRDTVCISSQVGCPMACTFCATGTMGLKRNLTAEEMLDQVLHFARMLRKEGKRVTNVVFMGMGEPMHNYEAVMESVRSMNGNGGKGLGIGARHISISTCGIVAGILRMADEPLQINLAVSLHAPNDELRTKLMPVNRAYPLGKLMPAIKDYIAKTNRKVMFEYLLIDGLNDTIEIADELADLMDHPLFHVNLIKYHTTGAFVSSPVENRSAFMDRLKKRGVSVTHRITFGEDIDAACGQLANKHIKKGTRA
jgi:23S rRNA (adenine2503-C2)-methyltransferase